MKVGSLESTMIQAPFATSSPIQSNNMSFQMILGATLDNSKEIMLIPSPNEELGSIADLVDLVDSLKGNVDLEINEQDRNVIESSMLETVLELINWLKENVDSIRLPDETNFEEPIPDDFLAASVLLFQVINEVNNETLENLPLDKMVPYVKAVKEFLFISKENVVSLSEMKQLEDLETSIDNLLLRLQELTKESKYQTMRKSIDHAFFKGKEINDLHPQIKNSNVLQSLLGKSPHDQLLNQRIVSQDVMINTNPALQTESFILHVSEPVNEETAMRGLIKEFANILGRSNLTQSPNATRLLIRLHPEELGTLRVELLQKDGQLTARILASTHKAKEILDYQINSLRQTFTQQNISIDRIEVTYNQDDLERYTNQENQGNQQHRNEQNQKQGESTAENSGDFKDALSNVLFETEV